MNLSSLVRSSLVLLAVAAAALSLGACAAGGPSMAGDPHAIDSAGGGHGGAAAAGASRAGPAATAASEAGSAPSGAGAARPGAPGSEATAGGVPMSLAAATPLTLLPAPQSVVRQPGSLTVRPEAAIRYDGFSGGRIPGGVARFEARLASAVADTPAPASAPAGGAPPLRLTIQCSGTAELAVGEDESYRLSVSASGALVSAPTDLGVLHGLVTLAQLATADDEGALLSFPYVSIADSPRYTWRGLLIDSARHFLPVSAVERTLDGMEEVKLNVLHWHLSDDQGFRVESLRYPLLTEEGSDGRFYTQDEIRAVVAYADARGIRVVPEFDMPAHTTSWLVGYPELASAPGPYHVEHRFGVFNAVMDPTREETYRFLAGFFAEMATLFPDAYLHIGGDENTGVDWANNPSIRTFMRDRGISSSAALQAYFSRRVAGILEEVGKRPIGWDEILMPDLPAGTVIDVWTNPLATFEAALAGYGSVLSRGYYLDAMEPAAEYYARDPGPLVEGGEASMWGELVDGTNLDERVWPRAAAIAERFWSPPSVADPADMYRRLAAESAWLTRLGLKQESGYEERLAAFLGDDARPGELERLKLFVDSLAPLGLFGRTHARRYTTATLFDRVVDAARPDSALERALSAQVERLLSGRGGLRARQAASAGLTGDAVLRGTLTAFRDNDRALAPALRRSPSLRPVRRLSAELSQLGAAGIAALDYLATGDRPDRGFCTRTQALLERAALPEAEVRLAVLAPIEELVSAACESEPGAPESSSP